MKKPFYSSFYGARQLQNTYRFFQELDELLRSRNAKHVVHPTVCVGNFQAGGTGKTPTTIWLAKELAKHGYAPSIVLRGHRARRKEAYCVKRSDHAKLVGDEALLHSIHFPTYIGRNRIAACQLAIDMNERLNHIIILDDGLQHYPLRSDIKLVCTKRLGFWNDQLLPFGRLRQKPHNQIDAILQISGDKNHREWESVPIYHFEHVPTLISGEKEPGLMVSGIADPQQFFNSIYPLIGNKTFDSWPFPDHHRFSVVDLRRIESKSYLYKHRVHCTAKDAVKLEPLIEAENSPVKLSVWDIEIQPVSDVQPLLDAMVAKIEEVFKNRTSKQV